MESIYNPRTDTLSLILKETSVVESDKIKPRVILDYDAKGDLVFGRDSGRLKTGYRALRHRVPKGLASTGRACVPRT
jgi:hypothetical protein